MPDPETFEERRRRVRLSFGLPVDGPGEEVAPVPPPSAPPVVTLDPTSLTSPFLRNRSATATALPRTAPGPERPEVDTLSLLRRVPGLAQAVLNYKGPAPPSFNPSPRDTFAQHVLPRVEQALLPLEAGTSGARGAVAFLPFLGNEEDIVAREALKGFFTGRIGPGEIGGELRRSMRRRPFIEQFLSGIATDPFLLGGAARQGVKVGTKQATRAIEAGRPLSLPAKTRPVTEVFPSRTRTVDELRQAGGFEVPFSPAEIKGGFRRPRTISEVRSYISEIEAEANLLRRVELQSQRVFSDIGDFSSREVEFLEDLVGKDISDIRFPDVQNAVREELAIVESRMQRAIARVDEKAALTLEAEESAMQRGIARIGLTEPSPALPGGGTPPIRGPISDTIHEIDLVAGLRKLSPETLQGPATPDLILDAVKKIQLARLGVVDRLGETAARNIFTPEEIVSRLYNSLEGSLTKDQIRVRGGAPRLREQVEDIFREIATSQVEETAPPHVSITSPALETRPITQALGALPPGRVGQTPPRPPVGPTAQTGRLTPESDPLIQRVITAIRETKPLTAESTEALSVGRGRQLARASAAAARETDPLQRGRVGRAAMAGDIPRPGREPIGQLFNEQEIGSLLDTYIWGPNSRLRRGGQPIGGYGHDQFNAADAFQELFHVDTTVIPTPGEIALLERAFGADFVRAIMSQRSLGQKSWDSFVDAWNLPRAMLSTLDVSATLRQAGTLAPGHPQEFAQAFKNQIKAFGSERFATEAQELRRADPDYLRFTRRGKEERLFQAERGISARPSAREERFLTGLAGRLPIIRNSERAYVEMLNGLRFSVMKRMVSTIERGGAQATDAQLDAIANFLNYATGRGPLWKAERSAPILNGLFFSPRLTTSRVALPASVLTRTPGVRRMIAQDIAAYALTGFMTLKILDATPGVDVAADPRSSDFGKVRIGKTRLDIFAGYLQPIRTAVQFAFGQRVSAGTGTISDVSRMEVVGRFMRSKAHPTLGLGIDVVSGEDFLGEEFARDTSSFLDPDIRRNPVLRTLAPLVIQDVSEALQKESLPMAALAGAGAALGAGVVTFETAEDAAQELYQRQYTDLWPYQQGHARDLSRQTSDRPPSEFDKVDTQHFADLKTIAQSGASTRDKRNQYFSVTTFYAGKRQGLARATFGDADFERQSGGTPEEQAALQEYYDAQAAMKPSPESALFDSDRWNQALSQLEPRWRRAGVLDYVRANTHTRPIPSELLIILPPTTQQRIRLSSQAREQHDRANPKRLTETGETAEERRRRVREAFGLTP